MGRDNVADMVNVSSITTNRLESGFRFREVLQGEDANEVQTRNLAGPEWCRSMSRASFSPGATAGNFDSMSASEDGCRLEGRTQHDDKCVETVLGCWN